MKQHAEAFQSEPYPDDEEPELESERKKGAVILPFKQKTNEGSEEKEKGQGYEKYKTLGGALSPEEYQDILKRVADGKNVPSSSPRSAANFMAQVAGITLSPETVTIYGILSDERPNLATERPNEMGDQELLAEALRIVGDTRSLAAFIEKYPHIFI
jgi:hypothetical protein